MYIKLQQSIFVLVTITINYVESVTFSDEPTKNYHSAVLASASALQSFASFHTVLDFGPTSHQGCHRQQFVVKKKKKAVIKPLYSTISAPNSTQMQVENSW